VKKDKAIACEFKGKNISTVDFAKKLLGQIVFLYFLQKKGWLGVEKGKHWGSGPRDFLRRLADRKYGAYDNFFNDALQPLFYDTLATDRGHDAWCKTFSCRIPFLNGGLFEPLSDYNWRRTDITIPNTLFTNTERMEKTGDIGTGILDVFDRYNFTVNEAEPLEKEVAIDPEMLGKVFENLIEENRRKGLGSYYTPREIVHYMCQESLINYLDTAVNTIDESILKATAKPKQERLLGPADPEQIELGTINSRPSVPRADIETFIRIGDQISHYEAVETAYRIKMPKSIIEHAKVIDDKLKEITVCDPAVGSGAFPVGMMTEIVRARSTLTSYFTDAHERTPYHFKRHAIQHSLYGVDIDAGAVEIAKLRLWLSLVVDEEDVTQIRPLPNLFYKIVGGNSLLGVEANLFNQQLFNRLEELKPLYFDEPDKDKKAHYKQQIEETIHELTHGKEAFDFEIYFSEVFHSRLGFDVILGNPPYVGQKGNKYLFQEIKRTAFGSKYHQRRMDLFYFFFHLGLAKAREHGTIAFITTNYYLTATYSDRLRKHLYEESSILRLVNFNELRIFESALGQHNLITIFIKSRNKVIDAATAVVRRAGIANPTILRSILSWRDPKTDYYQQPQDRVFEEKTLYMRLEPSGVHQGPVTVASGVISVLERIQSSGQHLGQFCFIEQGIVSGADKLSDSMIEKYPELSALKGAGIFVLTKHEIASLNLSSNEMKFVKRTYKNSDIKKWTFPIPAELFVLYIKSNGKYFEIGSNLQKYLNTFRSVLINRNIRYDKISWEEYRQFVAGKRNISYIMNASSMKAGNYYCLSYARRGIKTFEGEKIVNSRRSKSNCFALETSGCYEQSDIVITTVKDEYRKELDPRFILALLNSNLYSKWFYFKGKRKGEILEIFQKPLSEVPIRLISRPNQTPLIALVDRIVAAKQRDAGANVSVLEQELDKLVYALYGLTDHEIAMVENSINR
jgi:hypothetical protein